MIGELLSQPVSRHDNLYALGADSLGLVRLVARIKSRVGTRSADRRGHAARRCRRCAAAGRSAAPRSRQRRGRAAAQRAVLTVADLVLAPAAARSDRRHGRGVPCLPRICSPSMRTCSNGRFATLLGRHQALRCRLVGAADAEPSPRAASPKTELILLRAKPLEAARLDKARRSERNRPFDLRRELPLRVTLQPDADRPGESELWLSVHHSAYDGSSEADLLAGAAAHLSQSRKWYACTRGVGAVGGDVFRTGRETTCGIRCRDHAGARGLLAAAARRRAGSAANWR